MEQNKSALDRALTILECISTYPSGISLSDIAKETGIPKTTAFRLIETLNERSYIELDEFSERYTIGVKTLEVGIKGLRNLDLVEVSIPYLREMSFNTGETSFLGVYNDGEIVYLYKSEGTKAIQTTAQLGTSRPAYCTGLGKAILADMPMEEVDRVLSKEMKKFTKNTITDRIEFYEELAKVRLTKIAVDDEEIEMGLTCFAVPIYNFTGNAIGAISVAGPTERIHKNKDHLLPVLKETGNQISRRLGFVPSMKSTKR
ncbi:transcriptional regulator [Bacillus sp. FJAT-18017]|uniref:IclR family transcriptional regulator n=1 Tax=Bacillus sp. FJAT-18017 TaxID=1705566 RepID=UPI0006AE5558|nr:IclR family transcriptional regulator [Bacillus sp. FJAT-18017]ALC89206.1 transcriptional regulator [Bacillus sp. FJAT-18017]